MSILSPIDQPTAVTALQRSMADAQQTFKRFSVRALVDQIGQQGRVFGVYQLLQ